jgi:unsaturated chondroitin disaccharide hydrolase
VRFGLGAGATTALALVVAGATLLPTPPEVAIAAVSDTGAQAAAVQAEQARAATALRAPSPSTYCVANPKPATKRQLQAVIKLAKKKISRANSTVGPNAFPSGAHDGQRSFNMTGRHSWTSGFFPAQNWLMYRQAAAEYSSKKYSSKKKRQRANKSRKQWRKQARRTTVDLLPLADYRGSHDLGFMVGLPLGLAKSLDPKANRRARYTDVYRQAAQSLATRWNDNVGAIQSDTYEGEWGLIIDSAVNEAFLIEAGQEIGGSTGATLVDRGIRHQKTLIENFLRPDGSTIHRLKFNRTTGELIGSTPGQGLSADSTWSRGQAWAILGFARAYKATGDLQLRDAAVRVADYWLSQLPDGCVPAWDFDVRTPGQPRDSSASAIAAAGLLELSRAARSVPNAAAYKSSALTALGTLARKKFTKPSTKNPGILQRQSHSVPDLATEGSYAWGDAYFLLAAQDSPKGLKLLGR